MITYQTLQNARFVVDASGKHAAVQLNIDDWQKLLDYLEELEDRAKIKEVLHRLKNGPDKSGALDWSEARKKW